MILAETLAGRLTAFDIGPDGELSGRRSGPAPVVRARRHLSRRRRKRVVANAISQECWLVTEGGEVIDRVATSLNSFACMLGGADRRTLYIMTAPTSTESVVSADRTARIEQAGSAWEGRPA